MSLPTQTSVRPTLVFGLVAAVGTDLSSFDKTFRKLLAEYGYSAEPIRLTDLLKAHVAEAGTLSWSDEAERLECLMTAGDTLRKNLERGDAMALLASLGIASDQASHTGDKPRAYVVRQLKHPEEIATLRRIYGDRFFAIALYSTYEERLAHLQGGVGGIDEPRARTLMKRDEEDEANDYGQRTRDAFELGDVFIRLDPEELDAAEAKRFLDLLFGKPDLSPKQEEQAMYLAYAASLRSADLSRQVGASILSPGGDVVAVGANDVPCASGGQYWPGEADRRDHWKGYDSNAARKLEIAKDIFRRTNPEKSTDEAALREFLMQLEGSLLLDITEYGRAVHAEMEALLSCARSGTATRGARLFSTTFPCHNCAKHIVGAGIREVFYVEPYPKSLASPLHGDSIVSEEHDGVDISIETNCGEESRDKVIFRHYVGVGPRRYMDLFSLTLSSGRRVKRKVKSTGDLAPWDPKTAEPRVPSETSAADLQSIAIDELKKAMEQQE